MASAAVQACGRADAAPELFSDVAINGHLDRPAPRRGLPGATRRGQDWAAARQATWFNRLDRLRQRC